MVPIAVSRPLTPTIIGPLALSQTMIIQTSQGSIRHESAGPSQFTTITTAITIPKIMLIIILTTMTMIIPRIIRPFMVIILRVGLSVGLSQFTTTATTITIPKTTSIIISKATIFIFFLKRILTVPQPLPEASLTLILQLNATLKMTITPSLIPITKNPKITSIIIPTATTIVVLILKTTMITIRMVTSLVPPLPLPPIATLIMLLLEEITRIICVYHVLSAIWMKLYYGFLNGNDWTSKVLTGLSRNRAIQVILHHYHRWWKWIKRSQWINDVKQINDINADTDQGLLVIQTEFYYVFLNKNDQNHPCHHHHHRRHHHHHHRWRKKDGDQDWSTWQATIWYVGRIGY